MQQWEYRIVPEEIDWDEETGPLGIEKNRLSQLGNEGWELVGVVPIQGPLENGNSCTVEIQYLFKRPKAAKESKSATETTPQRASAVQGAAARNPASKTAKSGFSQRAQRAAAKNASSNNKR